MEGKFNYDYSKTLWMKMYLATPDFTRGVSDVKITFEEALGILDPATAEDVAPPAAPFARQVAFRFAATNAPNAVAVVSLAADGSVARLDAFDDAARTRSAWSTEFLSPAELLPGVPFFRKIETTSVVDGRTVRATTSCDRLRVNEELPPSVFDPKAFF